MECVNRVKKEIYADFTVYSHSLTRAKIPELFLVGSKGESKVIKLSSASKGTGGGGSRLCCFL